MLFTKMSLFLTVIVIIFMINYLSKFKNSSNQYKYLYILFILLEIYCLSMFSQLFFGVELGMKLIYFEYITGCAAEFIPIIILALAFSYSGNFNIAKLKPLYLLPIIALVTLWSNDFTQLFYIHYSTVFKENIYGPMFVINAAYSYFFIAIALIIFIRASLNKSGFFSIQTFLIVIGFSVPILFNMAGAMKIITMDVYLTPILFTFTAFAFSLAIIKYKALNITPVAFRTVIDTMSDAFIVISDDGTIVDQNETFKRNFSGVLKANKDENLFEMIEQSGLMDLASLKEHINSSREEKKIIIQEYHIVKNEFDRYFEVDIHPIKAKKSEEYVGTLLLFKDITEHKTDIQVIKDKQDVIVKQGQLVTLGELAGGVAHDINTPISAIKAGLQMITEMYTPRDETEKELLFRMSNCTEKIIKIVNSMRNQIRNLGREQKFNFKIKEVIEDVKIITYNEIQKNRCNLNINIEDDLSVFGDPTKLGQVFTNLLLNAIQAYDGKPGKIDISLRKAPQNKILITFRDYAGGIPDRIKDYVFKNILTTKGTKGTGLGLYLAYSVIKGEFSGEITFETAEGEGTSFYIVLDRIKEEYTKVKKLKHEVEENEFTEVQNTDATTTENVVDNNTEVKTEVKIENKDIPIRAQL